MNFQAGIFFIALLVSVAVHAAIIALTDSPEGGESFESRPEARVHLRNMPPEEETREISPHQFPPHSSPETGDPYSPPPPEDSTFTPPSSAGSMENSHPAPPSRALSRSQNESLFIAAPSKAHFEEPSRDLHASSRATERKSSTGIPREKEPVSDPGEETLSTPLETKKLITAESGSSPHLSHFPVEKQEKPEPRQPSGSAVLTPSPETLRENFLAEKFSDIRRKILDQLLYPRIARKKRWEGDVEVRFILLPDGSARNIVASGSSGYWVLDEKAVAAVRSAAPFPNPPVETEVVVPVSYRLRP